MITLRSINEKIPDYFTKQVFANHGEGFSFQIAFEEKRINTSRAFFDHYTDW